MDMHAGFLPCSENWKTLLVINLRSDPATLLSVGTFPLTSGDIKSGPWHRGKKWEITQSTYIVGDFKVCKNRKAWVTHNFAYRV